MARGFHTTVGAASTDIITTALTTKPTLRSYHIWTNRLALAGSVGRMFQSAGALYQFYIFNTDGKIYFETTAWSTIGTWNGTGPATGAWHATGVSYDGGSASNVPVIYVSGSSISVAAQSTPTGTLGTTAGAFSIGNRASDSARCFNGTLAEFGVWDAILTAAEFAALGKGYSPLCIRPNALVEYVPLVRANVSRKLAAPSITGTAVQPHIRIIMPRGRKASRFISSAAAPVVPPVVDEAPTPQPQPAGGGRYAPPSYRKGYRRRIVFLEEELLEKHEQLRKLEQKQEVQETKVEDDGGKAAIEALSRTSEQIETIRLAIAELETEIAQETELRRDDEDAMTVILKALH